jgi:hypothetical protein
MQYKMNNNNNIEALARSADRGFNEFWSLHSFFQSLANRSADPAYLWHATTLLNTFNTYHCYDTHPDHWREIEPIFMNVRGGDSRNPDRRVYCRLASLELESTLGVVMTFTDTRGLFRMTLSEFDAVRNQNTRTNTRRDSQKQSPYYRHDATALANSLLAIKYHDKFSADYDEEQPHFIYPAFADITVLDLSRQQQQSDDTDVVAIGQYRGGTGEGDPVLFVNLKYVADWRLVIDAHVEATLLPPENVDDEQQQQQSIFRDMGDDYYDHLLSYWYGSDRSYLTENMRLVSDKSQNTGYFPSTTLPWNDSVEQFLRTVDFIPAFVHPHLLPELTNPLVVHNDAAFVEETRTEIRQHSRVIHLYTRHIQTVIRQISRFTVGHLVTQQKEDEEEEAGAERVASVSMYLLNGAQQAKGVQGGAAATGDDEDRELQQLLRIANERNMRETRDNLEHIAEQQVKLIRRLEQVVARAIVQIESFADAIRLTGPTEAKRVIK